jgi:hypothetical protein
MKMEKIARAIMGIKNSSRIRNSEGIDITTFYNYYGTVKQTQSINDKILIKKSNFWDRLFRRK